MASVTHAGDTLAAQIKFVVEADPVTQGSMVSVQRGAKGAVRHQNAPRLYFWRDKVRDAARAKMQEEGYRAWSGPVGIRISFGLPAPKDARHGYPKARDLDKLIRAVLDALTGTCYLDDGQVTTIEAEKVFQSVTVIEVYCIARKSPKDAFEQTRFW